MNVKVLQCSICSQDVLCSNDAAKIICWQCISESWSNDSAGYNPNIKKNKGYPRGWKFKKLFVSSTGIVYHNGVEQPHLKGTVDPTPVEIKPRLSKAQKQREKAAALAELGRLKKELKKETRKTYAKKLESQIKKLQRKIK